MGLPEHLMIFDVEDLFQIILWSSVVENDINASKLHQASRNHLVISFKHQTNPNNTDEPTNSMTIE